MDRDPSSAQAMKTVVMWLAVWGVAGVSPGVEWDITAEFSPTDNPSGAWSYGWEPTVGGPFSLFTDRRIDRGTDTIWHVIRGDWTSPALWKNESGSTVARVPDGWVSIHPGEDFAPAVARWTSPISGEISVEGRFVENASDAVLDAYIQLNGSTIWSRMDFSQDEVFSLLLTVQAGDTLDWMTSGDYVDGNTPIDIKINSSARLFRRGDADDNGRLDITDAVFTLSYLFLGGPAPSCFKAADADDTGGVDLTDAVYNLTYLFLSGPLPREPFPGCGVDPTIDELDCALYSPCAGAG